MSFCVFLPPLHPAKLVQHSVLNKFVELYKHKETGKFVQHSVLNKCVEQIY